jgi:vacuolar-type H+-ATPase subunit I/STV1
VSKKLIIIITAVVGLLSFAGMFGLAWFTNPTPEAVQTTATPGPDDLRLTQPQIGVSGDGASVSGNMKRAMNEKQLNSLISEIREKIEEYDIKLKDLELREQRLLRAQDTTKKDVEEFTNLRIELASTVAALKDEKDKLEKTRIQIEVSEKTNLMSLAAAYDKMDSASAGNILTNISNAKSSSSEDAVKILHYMTERTKAKVLASIAETAPETSAYFCQKLKQIIEKK